MTRNRKLKCKSVDKAKNYWQLNKHQGKKLFLYLSVLQIGLGYAVWDLSPYLDCLFSGIKSCKVWLVSFMFSKKLLHISSLLLLREGSCKWASAVSYEFCGLIILKARFWIDLRLSHCMLWCKWGGPHSTSVFNHWSYQGAIHITQLHYTKTSTFKASEIK